MHEPKSFQEAIKFLDDLNKLPLSLHKRRLFNRVLRLKKLIGLEAPPILIQWELELIGKAAFSVFLVEEQILEDSKFDRSSVDMKLRNLGLSSKRVHTCKKSTRV